MISEEVKETLVKVCQALNKHGVDYLVVGGTAVAHYGFQRPSSISQYRSGIDVDLDFWYRPTAENYYNLLKALDDLQVDTSELKSIVFDSKKTFLKIPHEKFHTDFLPLISGLDSFRESKVQAERAVINGTDVYFISYADLVKSKTALNRKIDLSDIDELDKIRKKKSKGHGI